MSDSNNNHSPESIFRTHGGQMRMAEALSFGISRYQLYQMRDKGIIEAISRGVYRLVDLPSITNPDLLTVSSRFPKAVICLISALSWHEITTQIPHQVAVAVSRNARLPSLDYPPIQAYRFADKAYQAGIETVNIDGVEVQIYSVEKTLVDCFKFRNKLGMDVVLEALQLYRTRKQFKLKEILSFAKLCRVEQVMRPYLEAGL